MTTVSVIIPVYNRADTVRTAIDSALAQRVPDDLTVRVIIVDDGSSDDLETALAPYGDQIHLVRHVKNSGAAAARNSGIAEATGDYVAFLDSDDIWLPNKLAEQTAAMRSFGWRASCTAYNLTRADRTQVVSPRYATRSLGQDDLVWGCFVSPGSTLMTERSVFAEIGTLDVTLQRLEDWDWLLRYAKRHSLGFLALPLAQITASSFSNATPVLDAIAVLRERHLVDMTPPNRRHFAAALDLERAAAHFRQGRLTSTFSALIKSICRAPFGHVALAQILHNRLARG